MCIQCVCTPNTQHHVTNGTERNGTESRLEYAIHIVSYPRIVVKKPFSFRCTAHAAHIQSIDAGYGFHTYRFSFIYTNIYRYEYFSHLDFGSRNSCHIHTAIPTFLSRKGHTNRTLMNDTNYVLFNVTSLGQRQQPSNMQMHLHIRRYCKLHSNSNSFIHSH